MTTQETNQSVKTEPQFFYGYIVVVISFFILVVSWGTYNVFGVFFKPLLTEFGWTRAMTSGAFSLSVILHGVLAIVMGGLNDRFGPRLVVTICGFLIGLGYLLMSLTNALWQLYLFYGVIIGIGMSGIWVPLLSSVAKWFVRRRTLMSGIVISGSSTGSFIAPLVISRLIATYDWRLSYAILGGVVLITIVLAAQFLKRAPTQMGLLPYGEYENEGKRQGLKSDTKSYSLKEAVYTAQFWLVFVILFGFGYCMFAIRVHLVPHATDLGISMLSAANILATIGALSIVGNFVLGSVGDRIGNRKVFIIGFILMAATSFLLLPAKEVWLLYLCAVVFGLALGTGAAESPLIAGLFGLSSHGLIFGVVGLGFTAGAAVGPFVTGYIFDFTGSYQLAFFVSAVVGIIGLIVSRILRPTKKLGGRI